MTRKKKIVRTLIIIAVILLLLSAIIFQNSLVRLYVRIFHGLWRILPLSCSQRIPHVIHPDTGRGMPAVWLKGEWWSSAPAAMVWCPVPPTLAFITLQTMYTFRSRVRTTLWWLMEMWLPGQMERITMEPLPGSWKTGSGLKHRSKIARSRASARLQL